MNLWLIFLTGLTTGGLTCIAIQGGLLASVITNREEESTTHSFTILPIVSFLIAKLLAYTILGFFLGLFGSYFQLSLPFRILFQSFAAFYMLATAANLLNLHPIFRYVSIQPPKLIYKRLRNMAKAKDIFAPGLLGFLTILIPCGTTLAMEVLAISSGNALKGSLIMASFVLGTIPFFTIIGFSAYKLGDLYKQKFFRGAAFLVMILGIWSFNGVLNLVDSPITLEKVSNEIVSTVTFQPVKSNSTGQVAAQEHSITVLANGYLPDQLTVAVNKTVTLHLVTENNYSCSSSFVFPKFGISKQLPATGTVDVEFTPTEKGTFTWTCGMGMYRGTLRVI